MRNASPPLFRGKSCLWCDNEDIDQTEMNRMTDTSVNKAEELSFYILIYAFINKNKRV